MSRRASSGDPDARRKGEADEETGWLDDLRSAKESNDRLSKPDLASGTDRWSKLAALSGDSPPAGAARDGASGSGGRRAGGPPPPPVRGRSEPAADELPRRTPDATSGPASGPPSHSRPRAEEPSGRRARSEPDASSLVGRRARAEDANSGGHRAISEPEPPAVGRRARSEPDASSLVGRRARAEDANSGGHRAISEPEAPAVGRRARSEPDASSLIGRRARPDSQSAPPATPAAPGAKPEPDAAQGRRSRREPDAPAGHRVRDDAEAPGGGHRARREQPPPAGQRALREPPGSAPAGRSAVTDEPPPAAATGRRARPESGATPEAPPDAGWRGRRAETETGRRRMPDFAAGADHAAPERHVPRSPAGPMRPADAERPPPPSRTVVPPDEPRRRRPLFGERSRPVSPAGSASVSPPGSVPVPPPGSTPVSPAGPRRPARDAAPDPVSPAVRPPTSVPPPESRRPHSPSRSPGPAASIPPGEAVPPGDRPRVRLAASVEAIKGARSEVRRQLREQQRLRMWTLITLVVAVVGALPLYFVVQAASRDPGLTSLDALKVPSWAVLEKVDNSNGSRWCLLDCRYRERTAQSDRSIDETTAVYKNALVGAGWTMVTGIPGCPPIVADKEHASCWRRDEFTLDIWIREPLICTEDPLLRRPRIEPTATPATPGPEGSASPGPAASPEADPCAGSTVTIKVFNTIADERLRWDPDETADPELENLTDEDLGTPSPGATP